MTVSSSPPPSSRLVYGRNDSLFGAIERQQGATGFGAVLDAGTGLHSLRWMATLPALGMTSFTAITADAAMQRNVQKEADELGIAGIGDILIGNWFDPHKPLELDQQYDVILADYLIGAMDGFSPYTQDLMIPKLVHYLKPGGRLYIIGLQPIPDRVDGDANVMCKVRQVRDACILLAGHRCYREYPLDWIERHVSACEGLQLIDSSSFPILYRTDTIVRQINVARSKFGLFGNAALASAMAEVCDQLEAEATAAVDRSLTKRLPLGFDYVVTATKRKD